MKAMLQISAMRDVSGSPSGYHLSLAGTGSGGATASSRFRELPELLTALRDIGVDAAAIRLAEKTLKNGLTYTLPGIELADSDLRRLGAPQRERGRGGRER